MFRRRPDHTLAKEWADITREWAEIAQAWAEVARERAEEVLDD